MERIEKVQRIGRDYREEAVEPTLQLGIATVVRA